MIKKALQNFLLGSFSLLSLGASAQEQTLYDVLEQFNVKQADSLYLNTSDNHYYVKLSPAQFHEQSFRLVDESPLEELFIYSMKEGVAIEVSESNHAKIAPMDKSLVGKLYEVLDTIVLSHQHIKAYSEHIVQKISSRGDIGSLLTNATWAKRINKDSKILHVNYSVHGLTKYELDDESQIDFFNETFDEGKVELLESIFEMQAVGIRTLIEEKTALYSIVGAHKRIDCSKDVTCSPVHFYDKREMVDVLRFGGISIPPFTIRFVSRDAVENMIKASRTNK